MNKFVVLMVCLLAFVGCQEELELITVNDEIPSKITKNAELVLEDFTRSVQDSNVESFMKICVPGTETINSVYFEEFVRNEQLFSDLFIEKNIQKENKYYISDITKMGSVDYASEGYEFRTPQIDADSGSKLVYLIESTYNNYDVVFTIVLSEIKGNFLIERFTLGDIRPYGESIVSLLDKAESLENEGSLISAWQYNELSAGFVSPSPYIYYADDERIAMNMKRLAEDISQDFAFPIEVEISKDTFVKLYAIMSDKYEDGFYCRMIYVSNIPESEASDTLIRAEAKLLHQAATKVLAGLGEGFENRVLYTAYFEDPLVQGIDYKTVTVDLK